MRPKTPKPGEKVVFLFDVDNTLLNNDQVTLDLQNHLRREVGARGARRYWAIFEGLRAQLGYADYLGALQRFRTDYSHDLRLLTVSLLAAALPAQLGVPTLLSDGSLLFNVYTTNGNSLALSDPSSVLFEASSNLIGWIPLTNALTLTNGSALLRDPSASNDPVRFYRLMRQ